MHHTTIATYLMLTLITTLMGIGFYLMLTTPVGIPG